VHPLLLLFLWRKLLEHLPHHSQPAIFRHPETAIAVRVISFPALLFDEYPFNDNGNTMSLKIVMDQEDLTEENSRRYAL